MLERTRRGAVLLSALMLMVSLVGCTGGAGDGATANTGSSPQGAPAADTTEPYKEPPLPVPEKGSVEETLFRAVALLEGKDYVGFFKEIVHPKDLAEVTKDKSVEDVAAESGEKAFPNLLKAMKSVQRIKATLTEAGDEAEFKVDKELFGTDRLRFAKVDDKWRMVNE